MKIEDTVKDIPLREYAVSTRIDIEPERNKEIAIIQALFKHSLNKKISKTKIIKIAIDNLTQDLEKFENEEEAVEYLKELYQKALF